MMRAPTVSTMPPNHAIAMPKAVPNTTEIATTENATVHDTLAPSSTRRPMSRPRSSRPSTAENVGSSNVASSRIAFASPMSIGASAAASIHPTTIAILSFAVTGISRGLSADRPSCRRCPSTY